jgi:hypothetical protein
MVGFFFVRNIVTCWAITPLPGMTPADCGTITAGIDGPVLNEQGTPVATSIVPPPPVASIPESNLPPAWDGASRITVLLIGLDYRDYVANDGPPRSDSMILLTYAFQNSGHDVIPVIWVNIRLYDQHGAPFAVAANCLVVDYYQEDGRQFWRAHSILCPN